MSDDRPGIAAGDRVRDLEERLDGWRSVDDVRDAVAFDAVAAYSFPASRLGEIDADEDEDTGTEAFL
jgi:hypothetical protein